MKNVMIEYNNGSRIKLIASWGTSNFGRESVCNCLKALNRGETEKTPGSVPSENLIEIALKKNAH